MKLLSLIVAFTSSVVASQEIIVRPELSSATSDIWRTDWIGKYKESGQVFYHHCEPGAYMVGIRGRREDRIDRMQVWCSDGDWSEEWGGSGGTWVNTPPVEKASHQVKVHTNKDNVVEGITFGNGTRYFGKESSRYKAEKVYSTPVLRYKRFAYIGVNVYDDEIRAVTIGFRDVLDDKPDTGNGIYKPRTAEERARLKEEKERRFRAKK